MRDPNFCDALFDIDGRTECVHAKRLLHWLLQNTLVSEGAKCGLNRALNTVDELLVEKLRADTSSRAVVCVTPHK